MPNLAGMALVAVADALLQTRVISGAFRDALTSFLAHFAPAAATPGE
jgi:hypothetical protein